MDRHFIGHSLVEGNLEGVKKVECLEGFDRIGDEAFDRTASLRLMKPN